jgi:hypothetical protein
MVAVMGGWHWLPLSLCTFGLGMGLLAYNIFYKSQYYFYYNLVIQKNGWLLWFLDVTLCYRFHFY